MLLLLLRLRLLVMVVMVMMAMMRSIAHSYQRTFKQPLSQHTSTTHRERGYANKHHLTRTHERTNERTNDWHLRAHPRTTCGGHTRGINCFSRFPLLTYSADRVIDPIDQARKAF
uniref:Uncharacterized protein n=1 Tax=Anopheles braziliensis TaxID=58242 RepID=A0A2M3ZLN6_9DIPT